MRRECKKPVFESFDFTSWSSLIRTKRKKKGFDNASEFAIYVFLLTRVDIATQTYYKIEQGKQEPSVSQFMAINLALYGDFMPPKNIFDLCVNETWLTIRERINNPNEEALLVPDKWADENSQILEDKIKGYEVNNMIEDLAFNKEKYKFLNKYKGIFHDSSQYARPQATAEYKKTMAEIEADVDEIFRRIEEKKKEEKDEI